MYTNLTASEKSQIVEAYKRHYTYKHYGNDVLHITACIAQSIWPARTNTKAHANRWAAVLTYLCFHGYIELSLPENLKF